LGASRRKWLHAQRASKCAWKRRARGATGDAAERRLKHDLVRRIDPVVVEDRAAADQLGRTVAVHVGDADRTVKGPRVGTERDARPLERTVVLVSIDLLVLGLRDELDDSIAVNVGRRDALVAREQPLQSELEEVAAPA